MGKHDATVISVTPEGASAEAAPVPAPVPAPAAAGGYVEAPAEAPAIRKASKSSNRSDDSSKFHVDMSCLGRICQLLRIFDAIMNERDPKIIQNPGSRIFQRFSECKLRGGFLT